MKVLWFSGYRNKIAEKGSYGGGGWIQSLLNELEQSKTVELGNAFFYDTNTNPWIEGNVKHYPMYKKPRSRLRKLYYNWMGYKKVPYEEDVPLMLKAINDFNPDIIHIFGSEKSFASIQNHVKIPVVIYLQGILNPYLNAYYPPCINRWSFLTKTFSKNEWMFNNGYNANFKFMEYEANRELTHLKNAKFVIGRTTWDYEVSRLLSPSSSYHFLNEMLRPEFYTAKAWNKIKEEKFIIYTTISNVTYKGLDLVLKTAKILKNHSKINFEWQVAGIQNDNKIISFFEKEFSVKSSDVSLKYMGVRSAGQLIEDMQNSDVYVHPSYIDNSPNSLCEAQLLGLPVIACNVGGISSLIKNGITGILVPANAPFELAYKLKDIAEKNNLHHISHLAREEALSRHSKDQILKDLIRIYNNVLS